MLPIRYIVMDPTASASSSSAGSAPKIYYEKAAIENWLERRNVSPITRKTLSKSMLMPDVAVQILIDKRLGEYSQRLSQEMSRIGILPHNQDELVLAHASYS